MDTLQEVSDLTSEDHISEIVPFVVQEHQIFKLVAGCCFVSVLCSALSILQGNINSRDHNGLKLFWEMMTNGEVFSITFCFFFLVVRYYLDAQWKDDNICFIAALPVSGQTAVAYGWLFLWMIFIVSVLRTTTAVTWLHQLTTVDQLKDMAKGIGILMATLIYLLPIALLSRHSVSLMSLDSELQTNVCLPVWLVLPSRHTECFVIIAGYGIGVAVAIASGMLGRSSTKSIMAIPMGLLTHFVPTLVFCLWVNDFAALNQIPLSLVLIYCIVSAINSISNVTCYRLFLLASESDTSNTEKAKLLENNSNLTGSTDKYPITEKKQWDSQTFIV